MTDTDGALSPLDEAGVNALVEEGLAAIAAAGDLPALKEARLAFTGDASVLAGAPSSGSAEEWTVAGDGIDNDVMEAVRLCFASPYGFLR